jgi:hypothetical protein
VPSRPSATWASSGCSSRYPTWPSIEEITGLRLDNYTDRLIAQVALEILDSLGDEP